jgi:branched-chain amino acid transport system substrate-binding protein
MNRRRTRSSLVSLVAVLAVIAASCGDTAGTTTTTGAAATTTTAAAATTTSAAPETATPFKLGLLTDVSAAFAPWGAHVRDGMRLAVAELNAAGWDIELVEADSQNDGEAAKAALERLLEAGVVAVGGIISSGVAAEVNPLAEELGMPLFLVKAGSHAPPVLNLDSRYTFRTCLPAAPMVAGPVLQWAQEAGFERVGGFVADYAWGQAVNAALVAAFEGSGIELQVEVSPVAPGDQTTYLRALSDFGAEAIVATGHPPALVRGEIIGPAADFLDVPILGSWVPFEFAVGADEEAAIGRYADYTCADYSSAEYADLAVRYLAASDNLFMADDAVAGYGITLMVAEAVAAVGTDRTAIAEWLHTQSFDLPGYAHPVSWTEWGELAAAAPIIFLVDEGPAPAGLLKQGNWWLTELSRSDPLEPYVPGS